MDRHTLYPPQKVLHLDKAKSLKGEYFTCDYALLPKIDGIYLYVDYIDGVWYPPCTSSGRILPSVEHLLTSFKKLSVPNNSRLIFEGTIKGESFHTLNGIFNRKYEQAENVVFWFHDLINLKEPNIGFIHRHSDLKTVFNSNLSFDFTPEIVGIFEVTRSLATVNKFFDYVLSGQGEGIILKKIDSTYNFGKRDSSMLKIKEEVTEDCIVLDILEGEGKYRDTTGALVVARENGNVIKISGMTDAQREDWWFNRENILHKYIEVKAMKELLDGTLREPRFKCVRYDK